MRLALLRVVALSTLLTLAATGTAWAHVVVSPEEVPAGEFETLTVSVPTEKEIPTTKVRVEVPEDFTVVGVQPVPGWKYEFEEDGGVITAITWSGGEIKPREFQQFLVSAKAPDDPGEYPWRAFQTYQDGSVVKWTGPPDSEEPASVVRVVSGGAGESGSRSEAMAEPADTLPGTGGTNLVVYGIVGAGALVLGLSLLARLRRS
jgi:LPXTG-motif cell wall-anchored protein